MNVNRKRLSDPLEQILVSGSDTRSDIDARTGLNSFGCTPTPRPGALSFGSATASSISPRAFRHVQKERGQLLGRSSPAHILDEPMETLRGELKEQLGLSQTAVEVIFSSSGTDSALHALFLARALSGTTPLDAIVPASDETGSGVPHALSGRHFSTITAEGVSVTQGGPIAGLSEGVTLIPIPRRQPDGALRSPGEMDQRVLEAVAQSVAAGRRVLLQVMDSSKLGARCPSLACLQSIQSRFAESVDIVVDACQMRISLARLRRHLAQGHMALISGSKFFTRPPFSGALLVPASLSQHLELIRQAPPGLGDYANRSAWPSSWGSLRASLPDRANFGQYFRWTAALDEMRAYFSIPADFRRAALHQFAALATEMIRSRAPGLCLLEEWSPAAEESDDAEMGARTIFPFALRQGDGWLSFADSTTLYGALNQDVAACLPASASPQEKALAAKLCHIDQSVRVAMADGETTGALRLCAGARTVSQMWSRHQGRPSAISLEQPLFTEPTDNLIPTVIGLAKMARRSFDGVDMAPLWQQLTARFAENNTETAAVLKMYAALMDMCLIDQILDNAERGLSFQTQALEACRLYQIPAKTSPAKIKLLGFAMPGKIIANTPVEFLIEDSDITLYLLYVVPGMPLPPVPDHDLALVLVADGEEAQPVLQEIERLTANWPRPVLNRPSRVPQTGRECLYKVLAPLDGVAIPATIRVDRATWEGVGRGEIGIEAVLPDGGFPLIARPLDSHAGFGLEKIENVTEIAPYLVRHPEAEFHLSRFIDYHSPADGLYRKYRITIIDGEAFPCHMGVSDHWMIHFVNAGMLESAQKRAEEQRFMDCYSREFGHRHGRAIAAMADALGLDYFGIDCSETPDGQLLVFEAGTALVVHDMDSPDIFPYKSPHMRAVFQAFRALLSRNSRGAALKQAA